MSAGKQPSISGTQIHGQAHGMILFQATEIIGRREDGFLVRLFRGDELESDHSPSPPAPKFGQAGGSITTRVMISEILFGYFLFSRESDKYPRSRMSSGWCVELKIATQVVFNTRMRANLSGITQL